MSRTDTQSPHIMANIPLRFKRITATFDEVARARLCESSGSEHSASSDNSVTDLADLVDSFLEKGGDEYQSFELEEKTKRNNKKKKKKSDDDEEERDCSEADKSYGSSEAETKEMLMSLIGGGAAEENDAAARRMVGAEVEIACRSLGNKHSSEGFKRSVMTWLRQRGFDAGLCKSRWEKTARHPAGEYEYIDILISKRRYIIEVSLITAEFTIARPSETYASLLEMIPHILIIREGELKQMVRLMCNEMRLSLKKREMHVPPWRRNGYLQSKWFGSYKRTTNAVPSNSETGSRVGESAGRSMVGFEPLPAGGYCRKEVAARKAGLHGGNLLDSCV